MEKIEKDKEKQKLMKLLSQVLVKFIHIRLSLPLWIQTSVWEVWVQLLVKKLNGPLKKRMN